MLIDDLAFEIPGTVDDPGRVRAILYRAKHFVFDRPASEFVRRMAEEETSLIRDLNEFALPPFDVMAISNSYDDETASRFRASEVLTLYDHGRFKLLMKPRHPEEVAAGLVVIPGWTAAPAGELSVSNEELDVEFSISRHAGKTGDSRWRVSQDGQTVAEGAAADDVLGEIKQMMAPDDLKTVLALYQHRLLLDATFLLLAQPRLYQADFTQGRRTIRKGRPVPYYARSEIKIDLSAPKRFRRMFLTGARGSPRRHEVRRHFAHYGGDRSCIHDWEVAEPGVMKDGHIVHRWSCSRCTMRRVERGPFGRGDANKGFVRQSYALTANQGR